MEYPTDVPLVPSAASHRYTSTEQLDGVLGIAQVFDVWDRLCGSQRIRRVVRK